MYVCVYMYICIYTYVYIAQRPTWTLARGRRRAARPAARLLEYISISIYIYIYTYV